MPELEAPGAFDEIPRRCETFLDKVEAQKCYSVATDSRTARSKIICVESESGLNFDSEGAPNALKEGTKARASGPTIGGRKIVSAVPQKLLLLLPPFFHNINATAYSFSHSFPQSQTWASPISFPTQVSPS